MKSTNAIMLEKRNEMAADLTEALSNPDGLRAIAAAIQLPISQEIERTIVTPLLLQKHPVQFGETPRFLKMPRVKAYWISRHGEAMSSEVEEEDCEFPTHKIHSLYMVLTDDLKGGSIGTLQDIQKAVAKEIRRKIDKRTVKVILASVPPENTVSVTGGKLTEEGMNEAFSLLEDKELRVRTIVMRGRRHNDMRGWRLETVKDELVEKGIINKYAGAKILLTSAMDANEILILPGDNIGKYLIRQDLTTEAIHEPKRFKTGWLAWMNVGMGVLRPDIIAKVKILP